MDLKGFLEDVCRESGVQVDDEIGERLLEVHYAPVRRRLTLYSGTRETLRELRARGYRLGLLSNTMWPREFHEEDLREFGIAEFFEAFR